MAQQGEAAGLAGTSRNAGECQLELTTDRRALADIIERSLQHHPEPLWRSADNLGGHRIEVLSSRFCFISPIKFLIEEVDACHSVARPIL